MRTGALRCAVGAYCALAGALLLVAPHRLIGLPAMLLESGWPCWGLAFLLSGTVLLTGMVLLPPRVVKLVAHACAIGLLVLMAVGLSFEGRLRQLEARGIQVKTAADGPAALGALRTAAGAGQPFDLAILDMQMPSMDGLMLARQIVADPAIARVALALLTSLGHPGHRDELEGLGFVGALTKPIRQSQLWSWLEGLLGVQTEPAPDLRSVAPVVEPLSTIAGVRRILVAEDNVVNQRVVVRLLERLGYRVDVVTNGAEAVHAINRHSYVAVLMDCQTPEMDGYEATRAIRAEELARAADSGQAAGRRIPIIALTANAMAADRACFLASGMDDYLVKPLRPALLAVTLERWLPLDPADSCTPSDAENTLSRMAG